MKKPEKLNIEMSISTEHSCYVSIKDYTVYIEVSEATNNKPYISFWKKGWEDDRVVTLSH